MKMDRPMVRFGSSAATHARDQHLVDEVAAGGEHGDNYDQREEIV